MPNPPGPRIYFVGSHSSGKTTLARWVANRYGLPLITEVARSVLAETETTLDAMRVDVERTSDYQRRVFARQLAAEAAQSSGFVSDRAFDNLAYAAEHATVLGTLMASAGAIEYMRQVAHGVVLFVRPHKELLKADGVRTGLDWDSVVRIDGMIKLLLEQFEIPHLSIGTSSMQERVRSVEFVMRLLGVQPAAQTGTPCPREVK